jgi:hypothetical protein
MRLRYRPSRAILDVERANLTETPRRKKVEASGEVTFHPRLLANCRTFSGA